MTSQAEIAYEAYRANTGGVSLVSGQPIPGWSALPQAIQNAWEAAAKAVVEADSTPDVPFCPVHESLLRGGKLEAFDNCVACIRVERDELRRELVGARVALRLWKAAVRPHPHRKGEYLMLTINIKNALKATDSALSGSSAPGPIESRSQNIDSGSPEAEAREEFAEMGFALAKRRMQKLEADAANAERCRKETLNTLAELAAEKNQAAILRVRLEATQATLKAVRPYALHRLSCPKGWTPAGTCNCGLDAALAKNGGKA